MHEATAPISIATSERSVNLRKTVSVYIDLQIVANLRISEIDAE